MAATGFIHHIGTFLLLVATILLIVTSISAPVVNDIGLLRVKLSNATNEHYSEVSFGTFGYCVLNTAYVHVSNIVLPRGAPANVFLPAMIHVMPALAATLGTGQPMS